MTPYLNLQDWCELVKNQTNNNHHSEALETIAEYAFKNYATPRSKQILSYIRAILELQDFYGRANEIMAIREDITKAIMFQLSEQEKFEFNQCL